MPKYSHSLSYVNVWMDDAQTVMILAWIWRQSSTEYGLDGFLHQNEIKNWSGFSKTETRWPEQKMRGSAQKMGCERTENGLDHFSDLHSSQHRYLCHR
jgi:hypothetical protein